MPNRVSDQDPLSLDHRLRARRSELEQTALARVYAIDPTTVPDPAYLAGLRSALAAALDYGFARVNNPDREPQPIPVELLAQARLAARNNVTLDTVLRRYAAGHSLLADALLDEAGIAGIDPAEIKAVLRALASGYDHVVAAVSDEYRREMDANPHRSARQRHADLLRRLVAGELLDVSTLDYEFDAYHLAIVGQGIGVGEALSSLSEHLDRRFLLAEFDECSAWAWFGGRIPFGCTELTGITAFPWPDGSALACGISGHGLTGWRLSHRQAAAALPVAQRCTGDLVQYADVSLLSAALCDDLLNASLRQRYLAPLESERDGGRTAKATLQAYFAAAGNISSAAAALNVTRATVRSRLAAIETRLQRPLDAARADIEIALRLDQLETMS